LFSSFGFLLSTFLLRSGGLAAAEIQRGFKADEFPHEGVISGIGIAALLTEKVVEMKFWFDLQANLVRRNQSGTGQARPGNVDEARGNGAASGLAIGQSFPHEDFSGQAGNQVIR
jgi:hypothetical protein